jgi:hypothetical protein
LPRRLAPFARLSYGRTLNFGRVAKRSFAMTLVERIRRIQTPKFSFGKKTEYAETFARDCGAFSMFDNNYGLGIPDILSKGNQLRAVFFRISQMNGVFLFNISGVNMIRARRGFETFEDAEGNNEITEWELFMILTNNPDEQGLPEKLYLS